MNNTQGKKKGAAERELQLVFTARAWAKVTLIVKKSGSDEVSGFGISSENDPFLVEDFQILKQKVSGASTTIEGNSLAEYVSMMAMKGIDPHRCMRIWIHSHPFSLTTPSPSQIDVDTVLETLGDADWGVMVIVGKEPGNIGSVYGEFIARVPVLNTHLRVKMPVSLEWDSILSLSEIQEANESFSKMVGRSPTQIVKWTPGQSNSGQYNSGKYNRDHVSGQDDIFDWDTLSEEEWVEKRVDGLSSGNHGLTRKQEKKLRARLRREMWEEWNLIPGEPALEWAQWFQCRLEGFTSEEIQKWGKICVHYEPEQLRKDEREKAIKSP